jgi:hypothetical protein
MRTKLFRVLAALLSLLIIWVLIVGDRAGRSVRELAGFCFMAVLFGAFAFFGPRAADKLLDLVFGIKPPDDQQNHT